MEIWVLEADKPEPKLLESSTDLENAEPVKIKIQRIVKQVVIKKTKPLASVFVDFIALPPILILTADLLKLAQRRLQFKQT